MEEIIAMYTKTVYGIALTHTANRADADDVFQEVFLAYHRKNPTFNDEEHRKAWLIRTTINCSLQVTQSNWRKKAELIGDFTQPLAAELTDSADGEQFVFQTDEQTDVFAAVQALPEPYRSVIHLFYFEDLPVKTISAILDQRQGTIKTQLSRARAMLRTSLNGAYFND